MTVTNSGGQSGSLANGFTYIGQPTVTSVSPNNGPVAGGTAVTITGTNFAAGATVTFGSAAATNVVVVNSTTITAKTPAGSAGAVTVTVTNSGGQAGTWRMGSPTTRSVAISFAQVASATPQSSTASVSVTYPAAQTSGDMNVVVVGWNDTTATVQSVKDSAGNTYNLAIGPTERDGLAAIDLLCGEHSGWQQHGDGDVQPAAAYPDVRILEYRGVTAAGCDGGGEREQCEREQRRGDDDRSQRVDLRGEHGGDDDGGGGKRIYLADHHTPDGDIAEDKMVTAAGSNSATATLTSSGPWVMQMVGFSPVSGPAPTVSSVSPNSGSTAGGTAVTITGTNFAAGATVRFGSAAATNVVVVNSTTITATTPAGSAGAATVTVTNSGGQSGSLASGFTYIAGPTVSECIAEQRSGGGRDGGDDHGDELRGGRDGDVWQRGGDQRGGGEQHDDHGDDAGGQCGCGDGDGDNSGGQSGSLASGFTYIGTPTVSSVSPNSGSTSGGTAVTITGTNFAAGATVTFGSAAATNVVVVNSTTITATTPAGSAGAVTVTVTNLLGRRAGA